jgi:hypothetical protein
MKFIYMVCEKDNVLHITVALSFKDNLITLPLSLCLQTS